MSNQPQPGWGPQQQPGPVGTPQWGPPASKKKNPAKPILIGLGAFVVTIGVIAAATGSGDKQHTASPAVPVSVTTVVTESPTTEPATTDPGTSMSTWYANGGEGDMTAIATDLDTISTDAGAQDVLSMTTDCATLTSDVQSAQTDPPVPDRETQRHWAAALGHFARAASKCEDGATNMDSNALVQSSGEITAGSNELDRATQRVKQLVGD